MISEEEVKQKIKSMLDDSYSRGRVDVCILIREAFVVLSNMKVNPPLDKHTMGMVMDCLKTLEVKLGVHPG